MIQAVNKQVFEEYDEDRKQLARHLHDTVAQALAALQMNLSLVPAEQLSPRAAKALADCEELAQSCAKELKSAMQRLHPPLLGEARLEAALEALAKDKAVAEMHFASENRRELPAPIALHAYRIVEELAAPGTKIEVRRAGNNLTIRVAGGNGIRASTQERIASLGGGISRVVTPYETVLVTLTTTEES